MTERQLGPLPDRQRDPNRIARLAGAGFALIGLAAVGELSWSGLAIWDESGPGPSFAPGLLGVALVILGLILASGRVRTEPEEVDEEADPPARGSMLRFTLLLVGLIIAFPYLGGVIALSLFVSAEMLWVERSSFKSALLSGIGAFALIWLIFIKLLAVPLPPGLLSLLR